MSVAVPSFCDEHLESLHDAFDYIPKRALRFFLEGGEEKISALVNDMEMVLEKRDLFREDGTRLLYFGALLLAALQREEGIAFIRKIGSLSSDWIELFLGDRFFDSFTLAIAELHKYRIADLKEMIEDSNVNPALRAAGLQAMMVLFGRKIVHRNEIVSYFKSFLEKRSEKIPYFYDVIAGASFALHPEEMIEPIRTAYKEGYIDPQQIQLSEIEEVLALQKEQVVESSREMLAEDLSDLIAHLDAAYRGTEMPERNDPCPCGSGLKFKKCCI
jgi:hypothetical protein